MTKSTYIVLSILFAGSCLAASLQYAQFGGLAWFAFAPLLGLIRGKGFFVGFLCGLCVAFFAAYVATTGLWARYTDFSAGTAWLYTCFGFFGAAISVAFGAWAEKGASKGAWWFASLAVLAEACLLVQLPANMALTQFRHPLIVQLASFGGIWLVSWLIWWTNFRLAAMPFKTVWPVSALLLSAWILTRAVHFHPRYDAFYMAIQTSSTDPEELARLHKLASSEEPKLVVWPEFSGMVMAPSGNAAELRSLASQGGMSPFVTTFQDGTAPLPHNVAELFSNTAEGHRYAKRKLFGGERSMHAAGSEAVADGDVGLNICFDSCFPSVMKSTASLPGVRVLALPTIDPPSAHYFIAQLHSAYTPFRSAELGLPIVRADGNAYSMITDNLGQIVAEATPGDAVMGGRTTSVPRWTLFHLIGDYVLALPLLAWLLGIQWRRKSLHNGNNQAI